MASLTTIFNNLLFRTQYTLPKAKPGQIAVSIIAIAAGLPLLQYTYFDYSDWLRLGPGGPPNNLLGYTLVKFLGLFGSRDIYSTDCYTAIALRNTNENTSYLSSPLPTRSGPRPDVSRWAAPVRQLTDVSPEYLKTLLADSIQSIATSQPESLLARPSQIEGRHHAHNALHTQPGQEEPTRMFSTRGELETYHFHPSDGSAHAMLSAVDVKKLLEAGWGERHPLSGARYGGIPINYVMLYAPRDEEEVGVHEMVARAASAYALRDGQMLVKDHGNLDDAKDVELDEGKLFS